LESNRRWAIFRGFRGSGLVETNMYKFVWKAWAPPKMKNHAWLVL
jgi:hypothetical protein